MRKPALVPLLIIMVFTAGTGLWAFQRPVDGDEGYYAGAAREVAAGRAPYADFFYPQTPLLPYAYAPAQRLAGNSLPGLRLLSVVCGGLSLWLWSGYVRRHRDGRPVILAAGLLMVALDPHFLSWNVTVKTYALVNLLVFGTLAALDRGWENRAAGWFGLAGLLAGLTVGVRLLYLPWAGALWLGLLRPCPSAPKGGSGRGAPVGMSLGLLAGLAPTLGFFLRDADRFLFNNLRYHTMRFSPHDGPGGKFIDQAGDALLTLLKTLVLNPYLLALVVLAVWGGISWRRRAGRRGPSLPNLWGAAAAVHALVCLFPDPVYEQYYTGTMTALLAPLALVGLGDLIGRVPNPRRAWIGALLLAVGLSAFELGVRRTGLSGEEVWTLGHQRRVAAAVAANSAPGDMVLAYWSGYPFTAGRRYVPGMENHFALGISEQLTLEQKIRYHIAGKELLMEAQVRRVPKLVVLGAWMHEINTRIEQAHLPVLLQELERNYELVEVIGEVKILRRRTGPSPAP